MPGRLMPRLQVAYDLIRWQAQRDPVAKHQVTVRIGVNNELNDD